MSRPPRPHFRTSTTGRQDGRRRRFDYLPSELADFVALERRLAEEELGLVTTDGEGDFARTLMELSGLVGHVLGVYQDLYAREAFLGTAREDRSLVRHARRLAYRPDPGLAATGYVALTIQEGLSGTVAAGFQLATSPRGDVPAQDYETRDDLSVDAARNEMRPVASRVAVEVAFDGDGRAELALAGTGYGFQAGDPVLLRLSDVEGHELWVENASEDPGEDTTTLAVRGGPADTALAAAGATLLGKPALGLHPFAWNASPSAFPAELVAKAGDYSAPEVEPTNGASDSIGTVTIGYLSQDTEDVFLAEEAPRTLLGTWVLHVGETGSRILRVTGEQLSGVSLKRGEIIAVPVPKLDADGGVVRDEDGTLQTVDRPQLVETEHSGTGTVLRVTDLQGTVQVRPGLEFPAVYHADWRVRAPLVEDVPNPTSLAAPLAVDSDLEGLEPGGYVAFSDLADTTAQVVEVRKVDAGTGELWWQEVTGAPADGFTLGNLKVLGNVGRLAHGRTIEEVLGDSDGVTPFLSFTLRQAPLTLLPGADGGEPAIEVRVQDVAWKRVADFYDSAPQDRHYRLEIDHEQQATVIFGDGRRGAIPPSGKKHVRATYKVGLGTDGNADAGLAGRIKKAHPLVHQASNPTALAGGAAPAATEDLRHQAIRHIRTFDRAVSVEDHADLALLFPGVARAAADWSDAGGIRLVVADAEGEAPADRAAVESFLGQRRDVSVPLVLVDPEPVDLYLTVTVEHDPAHLVENVKTAVREALFGSEPPGLFTFAAREFGQAAHLSEVYAAVQGATGVTFARVRRFALTPGEAVYDVLQVDTHQWLRLAPASFQITASAGAAT